MTVRGVTARSEQGRESEQRYSLVLARVSALAARINLPLLVIIAAGAAFTVYYTRQVTEWSVMTDELLYVKLGLNIGDSLSPFPQMHGEDFAVFNQLYPLLTAPVYQMFDMPTAFRVVHILNAFIMASAAIPAYLLAREVVSRRISAYLVAAITVAVPWMTLATTILTEVAAYPAFIWALLAMQRAIARPSVSRDLLALGAIALAFLGRTQFIALAPMLVLAVVVHEVGFEAFGPRRMPMRQALRNGVRIFLGDHRVLAIASAAALLVAVPALIQGSLSEVLGNYEAATERSLLPEGIMRATAVHLDFVVVAVGIAPFVLASAWIISSISRPTDKAGHAYAVLLGLTVLVLTFQVSAFDLNFANGGIVDRYLFYIVPLLAVGMVACLVGPSRPWPAILVAGLVFAAIVGVADYAPSGGPFFDSPASAFHTVLDGRSYSLGRHLGADDLSPDTALTIATVLLTIGLAAAVRYAPRQVVFWAVGLSVLAFSVAETRYAFGRIVLGSDGNAQALKGESLEGRDWIDEALSGLPSVALVPTPITALPASGDREGAPAFVPEFERRWWYAEAWNKSVDRAYSFEGSPTYTPFPRGQMTIDFETGQLVADEQSPYLVMAPSDPRFRPAGRVVAENLIQLLRAERPYRAEWATRRVRADGWTRPGKPATLRVFGEGGRRVRVTLASTTDLGGPRRYTITSVGSRREGKLPLGANRTESLSLCVRGNYADMRIDVPQTSRLPDERLVGLQIVQIQTEPSPAACAASGSRG